MKTGVIFDLDGVLVSTDENHYQAWRRLTEEEDIPFDRTVNELLRGVSRMESLAIILKNAGKVYSSEEREQLCRRKNQYYRESLAALSPADVLPGVHEVLQELQKRKIRVAVGSSSKNASLILQKVGLSTAFDAVADGTMIVHSKPDPEVFLLAARLLKTAPGDCVVVEDAGAGVEAALNAGMRVTGVGTAQYDSRVHYRANGLAHAEVDRLLADV